LNLSLSGIPFNGPDVGGFINDTTEPLMLDWMKAGFLFPFFRNHCGSGQRRQEPWAFSQGALGVITWYTSLRYKLLPYLYQLFIQQETQGDPILRPIQYHYPGGDMPDDMFLVGEQILQAPILEEGKSRKVRLPGRKQWYDARWGKWVKGTLEVECGPADTPLYFADGAIIPCLPGIRRTNEKDLRDIELHLFVNAGSAEGEYIYDDGESLDYQKGKQSRLGIKVSYRAGRLNIETEQLESGYGELTNIKFVFYGQPKMVKVNGKRVRVKHEKVCWTGLHMPVITFGMA
jgi:alpha-glucosidase